MCLKKKKKKKKGRAMDGFVCLSCMDKGGEWDRLMGDKNIQICLGRPIGEQYPDIFVPHETGKVVKVGCLCIAITPFLNVSKEKKAMYVFVCRSKKAVFRSMESIFSHTFPALLPRGG